MAVEYEAFLPRIIHTVISFVEFTEWVSCQWTRVLDPRSDWVFFAPRWILWNFRLMLIIVICEVCLIALILPIFYMLTLTSIWVMERFVERCWIRALVNGLWGWVKLEHDLTFFYNFCVLFAQDGPKNIDSAFWLALSCDHGLAIALPNACWLVFSWKTRNRLLEANDVRADDFLTTHAACGLCSSHTIMQIPGLVIVQQCHFAT